MCYRLCRSPGHFPPLQMLSSSCSPGGLPALMHLRAPPSCSQAQMLPTMTDGTERIQRLCPQNKTVRPSPGLRPMFLSDACVLSPCQQGEPSALSITDTSSLPIVQVISSGCPVLGLCPTTGLVSSHLPIRRCSFILLLLKVQRLQHHYCHTNTK